MYKEIEHSSYIISLATVFVKGLPLVVFQTIKLYIDCLLLLPWSYRRLVCML